jgi:hypothetical protein
MLPFANICQQTFANSCDDAVTIKSLIEVGCWAEAAYKNWSVFLQSSFRLVEEQRKARGEG